MSQQHRLNQMLEALSREGRLSIDDIVERFGVSPATARRDLTVLTEKRLVTRTHGGAVAVGSAYELPLQYKLARNAQAKKAIANAIAAMISPGDVVGLTGGTTTSEVARAIGAAAHLENEGSSGVTIVTNALNIAYELAIRPHVKIVVTGGVARPQTFELVGPLVGESMSRVALDWAIIGVDGLTERFGATTVNEDESDANRKLVRAARRVVVAADSTKMGLSTFAQICSLSEISVLVTDAPLPADLKAALHRSDVEIFVVS